MTLQERLTTAEQRAVEVQQLRARALDAAQKAVNELVQLEGQIALLKDLIAEATS